MQPIDIIEIERYARQLRAQEMQRCSGLVASRVALWVKLLAHALLAGLLGLATLVRPLFSWNPQPVDTTANVSAAGRLLGKHMNRLNHFAQKLFSWNPQPLQLK